MNQLLFRGQSRFSSGGRGRKVGATAISRPLSVGGLAALTVCKGLDRCLWSQSAGNRGTAYGATATHSPPLLLL